GDDTFVYNSTGDGNDTIFDFGDGADVVDLDALFDALGGGFTSGNDAANAAARAAAVEIANVDADGDSSADDSVLTITGEGSFSITFIDVTLSGETDAALLLINQGIDVGT
ncbi:MAG: hypothetical protein O6829_03180, partial [Alphaproteobacteria bacterium]|nr:hypothetical protein [Alphaproteobacteria bacterium]